MPGPVGIYGGPGIAVMRPVRVSALVAFIRDGGWGASLSFGGSAVGWVPLGPRDVYVPAYHVSKKYLRTVNVANTTVVNNVNIMNVYNTVYVNRGNGAVNTANGRLANMTAPNAVTAMPQSDVASGRPVSRTGVTVPRGEVARVQSVPVTVVPAVAPVRQALAAASGPATRPPARVINTPVVARVAPPPAQVAFSAEEAILRQNAGRPIDMQSVRQAAPPVPVTPPAVRMAPSAPTATDPNPRQYRPPQQLASSPRPADASPQPAQPNYRPVEIYSRPSQPAPPRPYEAAPRPQPAPAPRVAPSEHREPKLETREDKSDKDKPKY